MLPIVPGVGEWQEKWGVDKFLRAIGYREVRMGLMDCPGGSQHRLNGPIGLLLLNSMINYLHPSDRDEKDNI